MNLLWEELSMGTPDLRELARFSIRLVAASIFGALIGYERERKGKPAGLRTHMLVALGSALFVVISKEIGLSGEAVSRVIQGVATGIGFIGGGAILKLRDDHQIEGLTTAAGIWLTSAVGVAVGLGGLGLGLVCAVLALVILALLLPVEAHVQKGREKQPKCST